VKRRDFIGLVGGAAAWPLTASAQRAGGKIETIGLLAIEPWPPIDTFRQALNALGYIEGKNVRFEYRYAKGHNERLPELANDLVGLNVDVILTWRTDAVLAAKQATTTIPIVMGAIGDPRRQRCCHESGTSGRERHWILLARCRARGEAVATIKRSGPRCPCRKLTLSNIGGAVRPELASPACDRQSGRHAGSARPCAAIGAYEPRCNIFRKN
jgi:hypothetical protein